MLLTEHEERTVKRQRLSSSAGWPLMDPEKTYTVLGEEAHGQKFTVYDPHTMKQMFTIPQPTLQRDGQKFTVYDPHTMKRMFTIPQPALQCDADKTGEDPKLSPLDSDTLDEDHLRSLAYNDSSNFTGFDQLRLPTPSNVRYRYSRMYDSHRPINMEELQAQLLLLPGLLLDLPDGMSVEDDSDRRHASSSEADIATEHPQTEDIPMLSVEPEPSDIATPILTPTPLLTTPSLKRKRTDDGLLGLTTLLVAETDPRSKPPTIKRKSVTDDDSMVLASPLSSERDCGSVQPTVEQEPDINLIGLSDFHAPEEDRNADTTTSWTAKREAVEEGLLWLANALAQDIDGNSDAGDTRQITGVGLEVETDITAQRGVDIDQSEQAFKLPGTEDLPCAQRELRDVSVDDLQTLHLQEMDTSKMEVLQEALYPGPRLDSLGILKPVDIVRTPEEDCNADTITSWTAKREAIEEGLLWLANAVAQDIDGNSDAGDTRQITGVGLEVETDISAQRGMDIDQSERAFKLPGTEDLPSAHRELQDVSVDDLTIQSSIAKREAVEEGLLWIANNFSWDKDGNFVANDTRQIMEVGLEVETDITAQRGVDIDQSERAFKLPGTEDLPCAQRELQDVSVDDLQTLHLQEMDTSKLEVLQEALYPGPRLDSLGSSSLLTLCVRRRKTAMPIPSPCCKARSHHYLKSLLKKCFVAITFCLLAFKANVLLSHVIFF
ncbi:hypothetical protein GALMADRAFT_255156 [Galerina marginata CBS 339.88]|uniref:Uncharacterized protein n=1 Tax=Galerina marginata (strain CBS 339.88) TaxID=685588 RepID=A0A067SH75_GALM3|nr:hypothetical protein GALMADRAFT_255156 [Galerina marginata CBS 339.88]